MHRCKFFFPFLFLCSWMRCLLHIGLILFSLEKRYFINISLGKCSSEKSLDWFGLYWHFYHIKPISLPQKNPPKHAINKCRMTLTFKHFTQNTSIQFKMAISDFNLNEYRYIVNIICVYKNSRTIGPTSWEWMIEELSVYCNIVAELILHSHLLLSKFSELNYFHHERIMNLQ